MKKPNTLKAIFGGAILLFVTSSYAASTWDFSSCVGNSANQQTNQGNFGNSWGCSGTNGGPSVTAYAWGAQTVNSITTFQTAYLSPQGSSGFGVASRNEGLTVGTPNHAMDNNPMSTNVPDLIALKFASDVTLDKVTLGWNQSDADITVMAYKGGGGPTIKDKTALDLTAGGAGAGWALVQHVGDGTPDSATSSSSTDITRTVNAANVSSSWWLISAYNPAYTNGGQLDTVLDYVKLLSVASRDTPTTGVSEPGSLALLGLALVGMLSRRHRQQA